MKTAEIHTELKDAIANEFLAKLEESCEKRAKQIEKLSPVTEHGKIKYGILEQEKEIMEQYLGIA